MSERPPLNRSEPLGGLNLRHALIAMIDTMGHASVQELIEALTFGGFAIRSDAPNKTVSDALRHEVHKGRLCRVGRGRYAIGTLSRTTRYRVRSRLRHAVA